MRPTRRWPALVALLLAAATGCGGTAPPPPGPPASPPCDGSGPSAPPTAADPGATGSNEIVVATDTDASQGRARHRLIAKWNKQNPTRQARLVELGASTDAVHAAEAGATQNRYPHYDLFLLDIPWIPEFAAAGLIRPLDGLGFRPDGFFPGPWQAGCYQGRLYALPFTTDVGMLYTRKGSPALRSWAELAGAAAPGNGHLTMATQLKNYEGLSVNALEAIWDAGGHFVDQEAFLDAKARTGLTNLVRAAVHMVAGSTTFQEDETLSAFRSGTATYMRNWPYAVNVLHNARPTVEFTDHALPWPSVLGGWSLVLSAGSQHPRQAVELMKFMTEDGNQKDLFLDGGLLATRSAIYTDPGVLDQRQDAAELKSAVEHARSRPVTPHYAAVSAALRETISTLVVHEEDDPVVIGQALAALEARLVEAVTGR